MVTLNDLQWIHFGPAPVTPLLRGWAYSLKNVQEVYDVWHHHIITAKILSENLWESELNSKKSKEQSQNGIFLFILFLWGGGGVVEGKGLVAHNFGGRENSPYKIFPLEVLAFLGCYSPHLFQLHQISKYFIPPTHWYSKQWPLLNSVQMTWSIKPSRVHHIYYWYNFNRTHKIN